MLVNLPKPVVTTLTLLEVPQPIKQIKVVQIPS